MSDTILPFQEWPEGIAQASVPANENSLRNEALRRPCLGISNNVASPADGDLYIVGDTPTGNFSTFNENDLAFARVTDDGTSWYAWAPTDGLRVWMDDGSQKVYLGYSTAAWEDVSTSGMTNPMTTAGDIIVGGASGTPTRLGIGSNGQILGVVGGALAYTSAGAGDVVGPASATADSVALFDGTTGELLKDGAKTIAQIREIEQNSQSSAYTLVLSDAGKHILHPSADTTARIFTIPANSSVAYPIGTAITFVNQNAAGTITIAITTDTMRLAGAGTTGSRTLGANGVATALKITSTEWIISGTGLT